MICAYDRVYLESARRNLARMLDFAVYDMCYELQQFYHWFLMSGIAEQFGSGDYRFLAGMSGVELAYEVLDVSQIAYERRKPCYSVDRSEEYWTGWALAYYQWETSLTFREIISHHISIDHKQTNRQPNLGSGQTYSIGIVHRIEHISY